MRRVASSWSTSKPLSSKDRTETKMPKLSNRVKAFKLVDRAIRLQLSNHGEPSDVEGYLKLALELDPDSIDALQESAHFYDAVTPIRTKARKHALLCREKAQRVIGEMN